MLAQEGSAVSQSTHHLQELSAPNDPNGISKLERRRNQNRHNQRVWRE
jgi:hypothetical protein